MNNRTDRMLDGKQGELFVFGELLKRGVVPYLPVVDVAGIDCVVRKPGGDYIDIQVKTVSRAKDATWWIAYNVPEREDYYFALVSIPLGWTTWIVPASVYLELCTGPDKNGAYDLNLASKGREAKLAWYKDNWDQIAKQAEPFSVADSNGALAPG